VAINLVRNTIAIAPGQKFKSIHSGPMKTSSQSSETEEVPFRSQPPPVEQQ